MLPGNMMFVRLRGRKCRQMEWSNMFTYDEQPPPKIYQLALFDMPRSTFAHTLCIHECSSSTIASQTASQTASPIHLYTSQYSNRIYAPSSKVFFSFAFDFLYLLFGMDRKNNYVL